MLLSNCLLAQTASLLEGKLSSANHELASVRSQLQVWMCCSLDHALALAYDHKY
jgi:hypothetical protein